VAGVKTSVVLALVAATGAVPLAPRRTNLVVVRPPDRIVIPAGPFRMGSSPDQIRAAYELCTDEYRAGGASLVEGSLRCTARFDAEAPQRTVLLPGFAIDRTEVTVGAYRACVRQGACEGMPLVEARRAQHGEEHPVEAVTWYEAVAYCRWRGGRLASEAEWEKAARGPLGPTWPWGDRWDGARANHGRRERLTDEGAEGGGLDARDGHEGSAPVGSFPGGASPYGVMDMAGNVWEWTDGLYARDPPQASASFAPPGPTAGTDRVLRGGSYGVPPSDLRGARRIPLAPGERHLTVGFRCAYDARSP
jgi:formylglycine-generating enzyme required for sulfatase activity